MQRWFILTLLFIIFSISKLSAAELESESSLILTLPDTLIGAEFQPIALDDIDKDGTKDLIAGGCRHNGIVIFLNDNEGNLKYSRYLSDLYFNFYLACVGDIDNNGYIDIIGIKNDDTVRVLLNTAGEYNQILNIPVNYIPDRIVCADFNNDNFPDIAIKTKRPDGCLAIKNLAGIDFEEWHYVEIDYSRGIKLIDFNNDSFLDIILQESRRSHWIANNSGNGFQPADTKLLPLDGDFYSWTTISTIDLNNDSFIDLTWVNDDGDLTVHLNDGGNHFNDVYQYYPTGLNSYLFDHTILDINDDNNQEIAITDQIGNICLLERTVSNPLQYSQVQTMPSMDNPWFIMGGDVDGDSHNDIIYVGEDVVLGVYFNDGSGEYYSPQTIPLVNIPRGMTVNDFNNDGFYDFAITNMNNVNVYLHLENRNLSEPSVYPLYLEAEAITSGNFNGDSYPDIAAFQSSNNWIKILQNNGSEPMIFTDSINVGGVYELEAADLDNDGDSDLIAITGGGFHIFINNGENGFIVTDTLVNALRGYYHRYTFKVIDFDYDSDLDIISLSKVSEFDIYENLGNGEFNIIPGPSNDGDSKCLNVADIDGDNKYEVIIGKYLMPPNLMYSLAIYKYNEGIGSYEQTATTPTRYINNIEVSDYDYDSDIDIFISAPHGIFILKNDGLGNFQNFGTVGAYESPKYTVAVDIDNDLIIDLIGFDSRSPFMIYGRLHKKNYIIGDANDDGNINVGDAVFLINHVFRGGDGPYPTIAGDANCDESVNVGDAVFLINHVFKGGPGPDCN
ncbi:MAG: FG-GAP-like repeat-containing protein [Candidatus Zixiibacteriota bacterium]